jgi:Holliday junction resolvase RusA-like endonuclease
VSRWGVYYPPRYKQYRKALSELMTDEEVAVYTGPVDVGIVITCQRPASTKLPFPKPDVDNYAKGVLDAANKVLLADDWLVRSLVVMKQWGRSNVIDLFIKESSNAKRNPRSHCRSVVSRL